MQNLIYLVLFCALLVRCQTTFVDWDEKACLTNGNDYFTEVMQETMKSIETDTHWCNMKLDDINQSVNKTYYNWHVLGTISYRNGFTISLKGIELTKARAIFSTNNVNGQDHGNVYIDGTLKLNGLKVGYDVKANFADSDENSFSVTHEYKSIDILCSLNRNLYTNETTTSTGYPSVPGTRNVIIEYLPASKITDVVNREFTTNGGSFDKWGKDIIAPLMKKYASVVAFPEVRFGGC